MAYSYVNYGSNFTTGGPSTISLTYTPAAAGNLLVFVICFSSTSGIITALNDGGSTSDTYVTDQNIVGSSDQLLLVHVVNCSAASRTVTTAISSYSDVAIACYEYSGLSAYQASTGQQTGSGVAGADILSSGSITVSPAPAMLFGFCWDPNNGSSGLAPTVGTSPNAFTGRAAVWNGFVGGVVNAGVPEDFRITSAGSNSATFGCVSGNAYDPFLAICASFTESSRPGLGAYQFNTQPSGSSLASGAGVTTAASGSSFICSFVSDHQFSSGDLYVTDNKGNTWPAAPAAQIYLATTNSYLKVFVMQNGVGGSGHIVTAHDTGASYLQNCEFVEITNNGYSGVFPVLDISAVNSVYVASGTVNCAVTTAHPNEFIYACDRNDQGSTSSSLTIHGGFSGITNSSGNSYNEYASGYLLTSAATTTVNPAWTSTYSVDNGAVTMGFYLSTTTYYLPFNTTQFFSTDRVVQF